MQADGGLEAPHAVRAIGLATATILCTGGLDVIRKEA